MKATEGTFRDLMTQDRQFRVPLYQRHYKWNVDQQRDLWEDVLEQYRALAAAASSFPSHFIGSIVAVKLDEDPLHDFRHFRVVDGQQRLATLSLGIAALRDVAADDDAEQFDRLNNKYLVNATETPGSDLWARLVPGDEDASPYWAVLTDPAGVDRHTPIGAAYRFFAEQIRTLRSEGELSVSRLAKSFGERLSLVFVTVEEGERPHKIFESINATGVPLSQADLLRNYLFMVLGAQSNNVYSQHWRPLEKRLGQHLEGLIRDDLQAAGVFVKKDQVYRTHRAKLELVAEDLEKVAGKVRALQRRGEYYAVFVQPFGDPDLAKGLGIDGPTLDALRFLADWGASTVYPLLLHVYGLVDNEQATSDQAARCVHLLESFIARRHLGGVPTNVLNRLFIQTVKVLTASEPVDEQLHVELSRHPWPSDEALTEKVRAVPFYENGRAHQKRLILQRLEAGMRAEVAIDFDSADLSIEHILPQTLSAGWKEELEDAGYDPQTVFLQWGHTLGNLTLTAWNSEMSNKLFDRKQQILADSELRLNEALQAAESWGPDDIAQRADNLAVIAAGLWQGPLPGVEAMREGFDWSRIDSAVAAIPMGRWTSYGDLAIFGETVAMPVATHVANDSSGGNAYRVLSSDGSISPGFKWHSPHDERDVVEVLTGEGVEFDDSVRASQSQRMSPEDLEGLLENSAT